MSRNLAAKPAPIQFWESPKFAGVGVLLLVFLCGAVSGAVAMTVGHIVHPHPFWDNTSKTEYLKSVTQQLDLTPDQAQQMSSILDDFAKYYQTVLSDGRARILNILNDDQKRKFEKKLKERPR